MWKTLKKWWRYWAAKLGMKLEESADPKVQLEQAIAEARDQHRRLTEQAANVIANQKQMQLQARPRDGGVREGQRVRASGPAALRPGDAAGNADKAVELHAGGRGVRQQAHQPREARSTSSRRSSSRPSQASEQAKKMVEQNSSALQKKLAERQKLLSQLDQAKMQEQMSKAMAQLSETVGEEVPTFEQVRDKIEKRLAKAQATSDLSGAQVDTKMLEVEQAQMSAEAGARLSELRSRARPLCPRAARRRREEAAGEAKEAKADG